jgi:MoaA/NifB/PqqE/SkfB family radical SAM enzyme
MINFNKFYKSYIKIQRKAYFNIETTSRCRLQCPFCQRQRKGGKEKVKQAGEMSYQDMRKIYNFTDNINFCGQISDPIYHTDFLKILEIKKNEYPNKKMDIRTNGSGKKLDWWNKAYDLSDETTNWIFGLDGASQETANLYRIGTNFNQIFKVMQIGAKRNIPIQWQFILFEHNEHELNLAKKLCNENGIILNIIYSNRWPKEKMHLGINKSYVQIEEQTKNQKVPVQKYAKRYFNK